MYTLSNYDSCLILIRNRKSKTVCGRKPETVFTAISEDKLTFYAAVRETPEVVIKQPEANIFTINIIQQHSTAACIRFIGELNICFVLRFRKYHAVVKFESLPE